MQNEGCLYYWVKRYRHRHGPFAVILIFNALAPSPVPEAVKRYERRLFGQYRQSTDPKIYHTLSTCLARLRQGSQAIDEDHTHVLDFRKTTQPGVLSLAGWLPPAIQPESLREIVTQLITTDNEEQFQFCLLELQALNQLERLLDPEGSAAAHYAARNGFIGGLTFIQALVPALLNQPSVIFNETPLHVVSWELSQLCHATAHKLDALTMAFRWLIAAGVCTTLRSTRQDRLAGKSGGTPLHYLCAQPTPYALPIVRPLSYQFIAVAVGGIYLKRVMCDQSSSHKEIVAVLMLNPNKFCANHIDRFSIAALAPFSGFFSDNRLKPGYQMRHRLSVSSMLRDIEADSAWKSLCANWISCGKLDGNPANLLQIMHYIKLQIISKINGPQNLFIGDSAANQALGALIKWFHEPPFVSKDVASIN